LVTGFGLGNIEYMAKAASLPAATIGPCEAWNSGRAVKLAGDRVYPDWTITVYQNNDADVYRQFQEWQEDTLSHVGNTGPGSHGAYKRDGSVMQLTRNGGTVAQFNLVGAMPTELGALELASDSNDTPAEFTVTLSYDYFVMG